MGKIQSAPNAGNINYNDQNEVVSGTRQFNGNVGFYSTSPVAQADALTAADATALDGTVATNDTVTDNMRTRLNEIATALEALGLINS